MNLNETLRISIAYVKRPCIEHNVPELFYWLNISVRFNLHLTFDIWAQGVCIPNPIRMVKIYHFNFINWMDNSMNLLTWACAPPPRLNVPWCGVSITSQFPIVKEEYKNYLLRVDYKPTQYCLKCSTVCTYAKNDASSICTAILCDVMHPGKISSPVSILYSHICGSSVWF